MPLDTSSQPRRSCLIVPANAARMVAKASSLFVDEVIIDLEDAVPPSEKTAGLRRRVIEALVGGSWRTPLRAVRVNALGTPWFVDDLEEIVGGARSAVSAVVIPKVESASQLIAVDTQLTEIERRYGLAPIAVEAQIETALGLIRVEEIAASVDRLAALVFGAGDYAASLGLAEPVIGAPLGGYPGDRWHYARSRIAAAAHAFGLSPIDTPYAAFRDTQGLIATALHARGVGFVGKWAIHPAQIDPCNEVFTPTPEELVAAERVIEALEQARREGRGSGATADAVMVDEATRRSAMATLARGARS